MKAGDLDQFLGCKHAHPWEKLVLCEAIASNVKLGKANNGGLMTLFN